MPENTVMQWILWADPDVNPYLDAYRRLKVRGEELAEKTVDYVTDFFKEGTKGLEKMAGTPLRDFRLFVALKIPSDIKEDLNTLDIRDNVTEILRGIYLSPKLISPRVLINLLAKMMNDEVPDLEYDDTRPINKQVLLSETPIRSEWKKMRIGSKHLRCMTVKQMVKKGFHGVSFPFFH